MPTLVEVLKCFPVAFAERVECKGVQRDPVNPPRTAQIWREVFTGAPQDPILASCRLYGLVV